MFHSENWKVATVIGEKRMMERVAGRSGGTLGQIMQSLEALLKTLDFKEQWEVNECVCIYYSIHYE